MFFPCPAVLQYSPPMVRCQFSFPSGPPNIPCGDPFFFLPASFRPSLSRPPLLHPAPFSSHCVGRPHTSPHPFPSAGRGFFPLAGPDSPISSADFRKTPLRWLVRHSVFCGRLLRSHCRRNNPGVNVVLSPIFRCFVYRHRHILCSTFRIHGTSFFFRVLRGCLG